MARYDDLSNKSLTTSNINQLKSIISETNQLVNRHMIDIANRYNTENDPYNLRPTPSRVAALSNETSIKLIDEYIDEILDQLSINKNDSEEIKNQKLALLSVVRDCLRLETEELFKGFYFIVNLSKNLSTDPKDIEENSNILEVLNTTTVELGLNTKLYSKIDSTEEAKESFY